MARLQRWAVGVLLIALMLADVPRSALPEIAELRVAASGATTASLNAPGWLPKETTLPARISLGQAGMVGSLVRGLVEESTRGPAPAEPRLPALHLYAVLLPAPPPVTVAADQDLHRVHQGALGSARRPTGPPA